MGKGTFSINNSRRATGHRVKKCIITLYHIGAFLTFAGIIVAIVGMATRNLFQISIYDNRREAQFLRVLVYVGLFSTHSQVTEQGQKSADMTHNLELTDGRWHAARGLVVVGLLSAIAALVLHCVSVCTSPRRQRGWCMVLLEVLALLAAVVCLLVGLSLAESEIEVIHDNGDRQLLQMLLDNKLVTRREILGTNIRNIDTVNRLSAAATAASPTQSPSSAEANDADSLEQSVVPHGGQFHLRMTSPQYSFFLLIAADFLLLLGFLVVLINFVRVCKRFETEKKMLRQAESLRDEVANDALVDG